MKAILVVDIPDTCEECPCCYGYICLHLGREMGLWALKMGKPVDCPLKPMPTKKNEEIVIKGHTGEIAEAYQDGWNDCIDAITGETE